MLPVMEASNCNTFLFSISTTQYFPFKGEISDSSIMTCNNADGLKSIVFSHNGNVFYDFSLVQERDQERFASSQSNLWGFKVSSVNGVNQLTG